MSGVRRGGAGRQHRVDFLGGNLQSDEELVALLDHLDDEGWSVLAVQWIQPNPTTGHGWKVVSRRARTETVHVYVEPAGDPHPVVVPVPSWPGGGGGGMRWTS